jgi:hypothetical protein
MCPEIVEVLLHHGADPNEKFNGFSPWQNALYKIHHGVIEKWLAIVLLLLKHGADVNTYVEQRPQRRGGKIRYSAMYRVLEACDGLENSPWASLNANNLSNEVITWMRKKKARIYMSEPSAKGLRWTEQSLTRENSPFLTTADVISMSRRKHIGWIEEKVSTIPSRLLSFGRK